jgi:hypothetical protein
MSNLFSSVTDLDQRLIRFVHNNEQILEEWSVHLLELCRHPVILNNIDTSQRSKNPEMVGEYDFNIYFSHLTMSEMKSLTIISHYLNKDLRKLIFIALENGRKKYQFVSHIDQMIYMKDKQLTLFYLINAKNITPDALFGTLGNLIKRIKTEVENDYNNIILIFSLPFWKVSSFGRIEKYTGWSKHVKDQGSLRPNSEYLENIKDDYEYQRLYQLKRERFIKETSDLYQLTLGWIL